MSQFIDKIAQQIYEKDLPLDQLCIILPSQRAKKYLQRALSKAYGKPIFSPEIKTMNRWIQELSPVPIIENTRALFKLYETHLAVDKEEPQTLDEFLHWGKILFSDFDEMDRYLIDSKDLFRNLTNIKEIEEWSFRDAETLTEGQKKYMRFWDLLGDYYLHFNERLRKDDECYMGSAYKKVASNIDLVFGKDKQTHFIFAGFNALSPAEISIMKQLHRMGKAEIFIDADVFYLDNTNHEAGKFLREFLRELKLKTLPFVVDKLQTEKKEIHIVNCAQPTGQAKVSATILHDTIPHDELSKTLLLLADENLIVPVMKNIPKNVGNTNITLGLPLKNTALKSWVDLLFNVQEHNQQFKSKQIYHKDFIRFIKHPFIIGFCNQKELQSITEIEKHILTDNWTFIYPQKLNLGERIAELIQYFFSPWKIQEKEYPLKTIRELNTIIFSALDKKENAIERSILYHFDKAIVQLVAVLEEFRPNINLGTFKSLFNQHWINESIAYYGNPLDGLQVMGLLETRLIDFKNMIVVGLNEGSMPPTNPIQSMIMMDLRKYHNLPTPREKQGLFAHHFYRLLHTVQNCWITYSSSNIAGMSMDEPSRFIMQLELELARKNPHIQFKKYDYTLSTSEEQSNEISIDKSKAILKRLDAYFNRRTSASALKTALRCSLDFYYKYLLGFGEEDKVEEEVEANTFGNFIHKTLEILYRPFTQLDEKGNSRPNHHSIVALDIDKMLMQQKRIMEQQFIDFFHYKKDQNIEGKNYLSLEVAQLLTSNFLKNEKDQLQQEKQSLFIVGLEVQLKKSLSLNIFGEEKTINFTGIIDRIDDFNGEKRILDYKSGKCTDDDVKITHPRKRVVDEEEKIEHLVSVLKNKKYVFQLLVYNMLYDEKFRAYPEKTGIVSMINLKDGPFYLENKLTDTIEELMILFEKALIEIISRLYNTDIPFEHEDKRKFSYCSYCEA